MSIVVSGQVNNPVPMVSFQSQSVILSPENRNFVINPGIGTRGEKGEKGDKGNKGDPGSGVADFWEPEAAEDILAGQAVNVSPSGKARLASATTNTLPFVGIAYEDVVASMGAKIQIGGVVSREDWSSSTGSALLVVGSTYYLGKNPGSLSVNPASGSAASIQEVGRAISQTQMLIHAINYGRRA